MLRKLNLFIVGAVTLCLSFATPVYAIPRPGVSAKSAALYCPQTDEYLFEKDADRRMPPASTTKIMTALLTCESGRLAESVTVTSQAAAVEGSLMELRAGDRVSFRGLLYGMLLTSGNDAATAVAEALDGSCGKFVERMNERARLLGMGNTHFANPSGLPDENHYSSARDLAVLTAEALKNEAFADVCAKSEAAVYYGDPPYRRSLSNHNRLLDEYEGCIGVKTGFTKAAGRCLVSAAERNGVTLICVTLNDPDDWADHKSLLDYGFGIVGTTVFAPDTQSVLLPVTGADAGYLRVTCPQSAHVAGGGEITSQILLPPFVYAPVQKGDVVGEAAVYCGDRMITKLPLVAAQDVPARGAVKNEARSDKKNIFERIMEGIGSWKKK